MEVEDDGGTERGPNCWKCRGVGVVKTKDNKKRVASQDGQTSKRAKLPLETKGSQVVSVEPEVATLECKVCRGNGFIQRTRKSARLTISHEARPFKEFPNWSPPGPDPAGDQGKAHLKPRADEDLSYLTGKWRLFQKIDRHRYSTDDVVTAWYAKAVVDREGLEVQHHADIGCGIGSVLLMVAWLLPNTRSLGVEAQADRAAMANRSLEYNGAEGRVKAINEDLRNTNVILDNIETRGCKFDLVTGTPPYFPVAQGGLPPCRESAACLFEYRGGVEEYCAAAAKIMTPKGRFIVCDTSLAIDRVESGAAKAGLRVVRRLDAIPKDGKPSLFSVFDMVHQDSSSQGRDDEATYPVERIVVRDAKGQRTAEYANLLKDMGKPS